MSAAPAPTFVLVELHVADFDTWHREYERMHELRRNHGECGRRLFRVPADANKVVVLFAWDTAKNARDYFSSVALKDSVARAGGVTPPELTFLLELPDSPSDGGT